MAGGKWYLKKINGEWVDIRDLPASDPNSFYYNAPSTTTSTETEAEPQPEAPTERIYDYLTAEQWFTPEYHTAEYSSYWDPFLTEGTNWEDLASSYAGLPVVSGYWENGVFYPRQSLYNQASQLKELSRETETPSFEKWLGTSGAAYQTDLTQTEPYQGITELISGLADVTGDLEGAWAEAAKTSGFITETGEGDVAAYQDYLTGLREQSDLGVMGQQGVIGTEYETAARRAAAARVNQLVESNQQLIESLGMQSSAAAYSKMTEVSDMIQDELLQSDLKILEQDLLMRETEYEALVQRLQQAQTTGLAAGQQYLDQLVNNRTTALQAYATQLDTIVQNNQQTLTQYSMELERITAHADITYKSIMAQIGYDEHAMQMAEDRYNQYMMPYYDALDAWYQSELIRQGDEALALQAELGKTTVGEAIGGTLSGGLAGAGIGSAISPGIGTLVGTLVGAAAGLVSNVC